jgi:hypothetical protein
LRNEIGRRFIRASRFKKSSKGADPETKDLRSLDSSAFFSCITFRDEFSGVWNAPQTWEMRSD